MNKRLAIAALLGLAVLAASPPALGQSPAAPKRIGILGFSNPVAAKAFLDAFAGELGRLGWIEGRNLQTTYRFAEGDASRLDALAAELVSLKLDVIYAPTPGAALALHRATATIPIVMLGPNDPVALGLVKSLAHPGGNITGTSGSVGNEIYGKRVEILKDWLPQLSRLAVIYNPTELGSPEALVALQEYSSRLGVKVEAFAARDAAEIDAALNAMSRRRPDAVFVFNSAPNYTHRNTLCASLVRMRLPSHGGTTQYADAGCLLVYGSNAEGLAREGAGFVDQILRGANPADLPVRQPSTFELVINAPTAKALGLTVPKLLTLRADRIIE